MRERMRRLLSGILAILFLGAAIGESSISAEMTVVKRDQRDDGITPPGSSGEVPSTVQEKAPEGMADPREGGLEVVLGEWAVTLEAASIRPGKVTFAIQNKGARAHGLRVRSTSGRGRDRFEARSELIKPGGSATLTVSLPKGIYRVDCYVAEPGVGDHARLGMRTTLTVRADAPFVAVKPATSAPAVVIEKFSFSPEVLKIRVGTTVVWTNKDPAPHTVTAEDGSFESGTLQSGGTFSRTFNAPGSFPYRCALHPAMKGRVEVSQ